MKKEFCTKNQSIALKELGYDWNYIAFYFKENNKCARFAMSIERLPSQMISDIKLIIPAPLIQQAFRFFREKYGLYYTIFALINNQFAYEVDGKNIFINSDCNYKTYEEAEQVALDKLIELAKEIKESK